MGSPASGASPVILAANQLVANVNTAFFSAYASASVADRGMLSKVMMLDQPSTRLVEPYAYNESAPIPRRIRENEGVHHQAFRGVGFNIRNFPFGIAVDWHEDAEKFDTTRQLVQRAEEAGKNHVLLSELLFFQIINGTSNPDLLPSVPNAPDGAALYATTAGGADRFGVTDGNLQTGLGVASADAVVKSIDGALGRFSRFLGTNNQPLIHPSVLRQGVVVLYSPTNRSVMNRALKSAVIGEIYGANTAAAGIPNPLLGGDVPVLPWPDPRITTDDIFLFLVGGSHKSIVHQMFQRPEFSYADRTNSDNSRDYGTKGFYGKSIESAGVGPAYFTIKIDN